MSIKVIERNHLKISSWNIYTKKTTFQKTKQAWLTKKNKKHFLTESHSSEGEIKLPDSNKIVMAENEEQYTNCRSLCHCGFINTFIKMNLKQREGIVQDEQTLPIREESPYR